MEFKKALEKAKIQLMSHDDAVFITAVCLKLMHKVDDTCPTAYTNGKVIGYNTKFFMKLTEEERVFLIAHETWHVCFMHMARMDGKDRSRWNKACDYVINLMLVKRGFSMPKMGLLDHVYDGMSADDVYKLLENKPETPEGFGEDIQPIPDNDDGSDPVEEIENIIVTAAIQAKAYGSPQEIPGEIQIFLDRLLKPKLPWNRLLSKYLQARIKSDYTFKKPNKRYFPEHILPSMYSEGLVNVAIAVDASGSVTDEQFKVFISETATIMRKLKPAKITLVVFDTEINHTHEIHNISELKEIKFVGKGGTRIKPVLDWVSENKPTVTMVFTDGYFRINESLKVKPDLLWLIHGECEFQPGFGKVIQYTI